MIWTLGLLSLPALHRDKMEEVLYVERPPPEAGCVMHVQRVDTMLLDATYSIYVDNVRIIEGCNDFPSTVLYFLGVIYCFNLAYPTKMKSTLNFLQMVALKITGTGTKDQKVTKLLGKIKVEGKVSI